MKKYLSLLLVLVLAFGAFGCKKEDPKTETPQSETEIAGRDVLLDETAEVELNTEVLTEFLKEAANYDTGNYTYSAKTEANVAMGCGVAKLTWRVTEPKMIKTQNVTVTDRNGRSQSVRPTKKVRENQAVEFFNLIPDMDYTWKVEVTFSDGETITKESTFKTLPGPRIITIDGASNCRDMGGYKTDDGKTVKYGMVYRTAKLNNVTPTGIKTMTEVLGIRSELDLRNPAGESDSPVDTALSSVPDYKYVILSGPSYAPFFTAPEKREVVKQEILYFADENNYPLVYHCLAGADRTGVLGFYLLALLGVSENDIVADYEMTPNRERMGHQSEEAFYDFPSLMNAFKALPGTTFKEKAEKFALEILGIAPEDIAKIRSLMLE